MRVGEIYRKTPVGDEGGGFAGKPQSQMVKKVYQFVSFDLKIVDWCVTSKRNWAFATLNFQIISLNPKGLNFLNFIFRLFYETEIII